MTCGTNGGLGLTRSGIASGGGLYTDEHQQTGSGPEQKTHFTISLRRYLCVFKLEWLGIIAVSTFTFQHIQAKR
jgi:hypothetical protein